MKWGVALCLLFVALVTCQYDPPQQIHLAVTGDPSEMVISWKTSLPTESVAAVSPHGSTNQTSHTGTQKSYLASAGWFHSVTVTGMQPSTEYDYICGSPKGGYSDLFTFKTAPPVGSRDPRAFIMYGDMGIFEYSFQTVQHVSELVGHSSLDVDLIYQAGDYGYGNDREPMYYETSWNLFFDQMVLPMRQVPYMVAPGNHEESCGSSECDFYANNFTVYNDRFTMPSARSKGSPGANMWFSFNYGNVHWVTISTETDYPNCPYTDDTFGDQLGWLQADLAAASIDPNIDWIIAVGHRPMYCSVRSKTTFYGAPKDDTRQVQLAFEDLFHQYKVDLYVDGHVHGYERSYPVYQNKVTGSYSLNQYTDPDATVYIVNGNAGNIEGFYDDWHDVIPSWSAKRYWPNPEHGYGILETDGASSLRWTWYRNLGKPLDNDYFDYFEIIRSS